MYGYVYLTENIINGKYYVGKREKQTFDDKYKGSGKLLKRAISKYGWNSFVCQPIQWCTSKLELCEAEKQWIVKLDARNKEKGYNIAKGGDGGATRLGMKNTDERNRRASESMKGKKPNSETIKKISDTLKEYCKTTKPKNMFVKGCTSASKGRHLEIIDGKRRYVF